MDTSIFRSPWANGSPAPTALRVWVVHVRMLLDDAQGCPPCSTASAWRAGPTCGTNSGRGKGPEPYPHTPQE